MLVNFKTEETKAVSSEVSENSYSNADSLQIMLIAMLKAMSSLLNLQSKEMKGQSEISELSTSVSTAIIDDYKVQIEENYKLLEEQRNSDEVLKWFGWAATALSLVLGFVLGGPAGFVVALGLAALLTPGLTSPSKNGDSSILGKALDGILEDASPEVRGLVKVVTIVALCVAAGGAGSLGQAAANAGGRVAASSFSSARYLAVEAGVQGLGGLNPVYDFAMIGADENDQKRKEIAQWVSLGVNIAAGIGTGFVAFKTTPVRSYDVFGSTQGGRAFNSAVLTASALADGGKGAANIHGGKVRLDIADSQEGLALTNSIIVEQSGLQKLSQQQVSQRTKDYKSAVEEGNAAVNQYADWTTGLYATANAIAANAS